MSDVLNTAIAALNEKTGGSFDGSAKFVIEDEGSIVLDGAGARAGDDDTDVTLTANAAVFLDMMEGDLDPAAAFMSGKLSIEGDMGMAMKLGSVLS